MLADLDELRGAADVAEAQGTPDFDRRRSVDVRREGNSIVFSPGDEVHSLAWCLDVFARGVLEPTGPNATIARGPTGYAASAWSTDIGRAAGILPGPRPLYLEPPVVTVDGIDLGL